MKKVTVNQDEKNPIPVEVIASSIISISSGVSKLLAGRLNRRAVVLLIQHAAPTVAGTIPTQRDINAVLDGIDALEKAYLKPVKKS